MESGLTPELIQAVIAQKASQPSMFVSGWEDGVEEEENPDEIRLPENLVVDKSNLPKLREKAVQLLKAAMDGDIVVVTDILTAHGELVNVKDGDLYTPLHRASYENHPDVVEILLHHGAEVHSRTEDGWTPLHSAARWASVAAAKVLLEKAKADVNATTKGGLTPLHLASASTEDGNVDMAKLLLSQSNIDKTAKTGAGETAKDLSRQTSAEMMKLFEDD